MAFNLNKDNTPKFRIVTVNYNTDKYLADCISAVEKQTFQNFEMVIVNNSRDENISSLSAPDERFRFLQAPYNLGFAGGSNLGAKDCTTPYLAMLNPDTIPHSEWLSKIHSATLQHPKITMFSSTLLSPKEEDQLYSTGDFLMFLEYPGKAITADTSPRSQIKDIVFHLAGPPQFTSQVSF